MQPLEPGERRQLIKAYLAQYTKELNPPELERLSAAAPPTANPLYLKALLEELRVYGTYLPPKSAGWTIPDGPRVKDLYQLILARYEEDYQRDRPGLVGEAMSLLAAGPAGPVPGRAPRSPRSGRRAPARGHLVAHLLAAEHALLDQAGLLTFGHDYFRQAVRDRYLAEEARGGAAHLRLADYFDEQDLEMGEGPNLRKIDELPWQLARAEVWERLQGLLVGPAFFRQAWNNNQFEVKARWAQIEANSPLRLAAAHREVLQDPARQEAEYVWEVAVLLADTGHLEEALVLRGPPGGVLSPGREPGETFGLPGQPGEYPFCPGRPGRGPGPV